MNRYLLSIVGLFFVMQGFTQHGIAWGPEITIADGATYGNVRPRMTVTPDNQPVIVFGKTGGALHVAKGNGTGFNTPVPILPAAMGSYLAYWTGPDIASFGDTVIAVFKALPFETGNIYAVRSVDGGATFSDTIRVDSHTDGRVFLPALDMDLQGNPVVAYMVFTGSAGNPRYVMARSNDAGLTFEPQIDMTSGIAEEACDCCPSEMVINGTREVLMFRNNEDNIREIYAVLTNDQGANIAATENINHLEWSVSSCPSTGPAGVLIDDQLLSVSANKKTGQYRVYISAATVTTTDVSHQGTITVLPPSDPDGKQNYPRISGENDTIVMVWEEKDPTNADIFCTVTIDGTQEGLAVYKERANETTTGSQTNPEVIYKNGIVHLAYQDQAGDRVVYRKGIIQSVAGLNEQQTIPFNVAPNPSTDGVFTLSNVTFNDIESIQLMDLSGKIVEHTFGQTPNGTALRITETVSNGEYLLIIRYKNGGISSGKLLLQK